VRLAARLMFIALTREAFGASIFFKYERVRAQSKKWAPFFG
jgi:hypothetical protein